MNNPSIYQFLANAVLAVHVGVVLFVVGGLVLVIIGNQVGWRWVNAVGFRLAHMAAIAFVVAEAWLGIVCPLTTLENRLRSKTRGTIYDQGFIEYWLQRILFYDAPSWVFTLAYSLFGLAVVATWWMYPPAKNRST